MKYDYELLSLRIALTECRLRGGAVVIGAYEDSYMGPPEALYPNATAFEAYGAAIATSTSVRYLVLTVPEHISKLMNNAVIKSALISRRPLQHLCRHDPSRDTCAELLEKLALNMFVPLMRGIANNSSLRKVYIMSIHAAGGIMPYAITTPFRCDNNFHRDVCSTLTQISVISVLQELANKFSSTRYTAKRFFELAYTPDTRDYEYIVDRLGAPISPPPTEYQCFRLFLADLERRHQESCATMQHQISVNTVDNEIPKRFRMQIHSMWGTCVLERNRRHRFYETYSLGAIIDDDIGLLAAFKRSVLCNVYWDHFHNAYDYGTVFDSRNLLLRAFMADENARALCTNERPRGQYYEVKTFFSDRFLVSKNEYFSALSFILRGIALEAVLPSHRAYERVVDDVLLTGSEVEALFVELGEHSGAQDFLVEQNSIIAPRRKRSALVRRTPSETPEAIAMMRQPFICGAYQLSWIGGGRLDTLKIGNDDLNHLGVMSQEALGGMAAFAPHYFDIPVVVSDFFNTYFVRFMKGVTGGAIEEASWEHNRISDATGATTVESATNPERHRLKCLRSVRVRSNRGHRRRQHSIISNSDRWLHFSYIAIAVARNPLIHRVYFDTANLSDYTIFLPIHTRAAQFVRYMLACDRDRVFECFLLHTILYNNDDIYSDREFTEPLAVLSARALSSLLDDVMQHRAIQHLRLRIMATWFPKRELLTFARTLCTHPSLVVVDVKFIVIRERFERRGPNGQSVIHPANLLDAGEEHVYASGEAKHDAVLDEIKRAIEERGRTRMETFRVGLYDVDENDRSGDESKLDAYSPEQYTFEVLPQHVPLLQMAAARGLSVGRTEATRWLGRTVQR